MATASVPDSQQHLVQMTEPAGMGSSMGSSRYHRGLSMTDSPGAPGRDDSSRKMNKLLESRRIRLGFIDSKSTPTSFDTPRTAGRSRVMSADGVAALQDQTDVKTTSTATLTGLDETKEVVEGLPGDGPAEPVEQVARRGQLTALWSIFWHPFSVLLICFPLGILSTEHLLNFGPNWTFWFNFFALIPLAKFLGDFTEELDASLNNEILSGLLNATFGNAVEMIVTIQTINAGLLDVVKATLLGSILSNSLLVLGCSFFAGGLLNFGKSSLANEEMEQDASDRPASAPGVSPEHSELWHTSGQQEQSEHWHMAMEKEQNFVNTTAATNVSMSLLLVSVMCIALPTVFTQAYDTSPRGKDTVLSFSRFCSVVMVFSYVAYLLFQLLTHRKLLSRVQEEEGEEGEDDDEPEGLTAKTSIALLALTTLLTAISSKFLVDVLEAVVDKAGISELFIGIILLPIVGNACEHAAAVRFSIHDKPGLAVSICVGSSTQVSLLVIPFAVLLGWAVNKPMDLNFGLLNTVVMAISVIVVLSILVTGHANWIQGWVLCSVYAIIAVIYWHVRTSKEDAAVTGEMIGVPRNPWVL